MVLCQVVKIRYGFDPLLGRARTHYVWLVFKKDYD